MFSDYLSWLLDRSISTDLKDGVIASNNGDGTYDVLIGNYAVPCESVWPAVKRHTFNIGQSVVVAFENGDRQRPRIFGRGNEESGSYWRKSGKIIFWPMYRNNPQRNALTSLFKIPKMGAVTDIKKISDKNSNFLRVVGKYILEMTQTGIFKYKLNGTLDSKMSSVIFGTGVYDKDISTFYAVSGNNIKAYNVVDNTLRSEASYGGINSEPLFFNGKLWVINTSNIYKWIFKKLKNGEVGSVLDSKDFTWWNWGLLGFDRPQPGWPQEITNSHSPRSPGDAVAAYGDPPPLSSFPIFPFLEPLYGAEASLQRYRESFVTESGVIIPNGNDPDFIQSLKDEREHTFQYERNFPRNYAYVNQRSQLSGFNPENPSQSWSIGSYGGDSYTGYTPVCVIGDKVIAHWETHSFSAETFRYMSGSGDIRDWIRNYIQNGAHPNFGAIEWPNWVPAPRWSWDSTFKLQPQREEVAERLGDPGFSAPVTRDVRKSMTHGLTVVNALTGQIIKSKLLIPDKMKEYGVSYDTGDPRCNLHWMPHLPQIAHAPRPMFTGEVKDFEGVLEGLHDGGGSLEAALRLPPDYYIFAYVAEEEFVGDAWSKETADQTDDWWNTDGRDDKFYKGHIWYGGNDMVDGVTVWKFAPFVSESYKDPIGRWSHKTKKTKYFTKAVKRKTVETKYQAEDYAYDPYNVVTDGKTLFFLPRRPSSEDDGLTIKLYGWYPPGSRFGMDGSLNISGDVLPYYITGGGGNPVTEIGWLTFFTTPPENSGPGPGGDHFNIYEWEYYTWEGLTRRQQGKKIGEIPKFGYFWDGTVVNWNNMPTGRGETKHKYGPPKDLLPPGIYHPDANPLGKTIPPSIPKIDKLAGSLMAVDLATLEADGGNGKVVPKWVGHFGVTVTKVPPVAIIFSDFLWMWHGGVIYKMQTKDGVIVKELPVAGSADWTKADLVPIDGKLCLCGNTGTYFIE